MMKAKQVLSNILAVLLALQGAVVSQLINIQPAEAGSPLMIISEVNWAGTRNSSGTNFDQDEWLELYNPSGTETVLLDDWTLEIVNDNTSTVQIFNFPAGSFVAPGNYFLVSRRSFIESNSMLNVASDWVEANLTTLSNSDCRISRPRLKDGLGVVIDEVVCTSTGNRWPAGRSVTGGARYAMERVGLDGQSWQDSSGFVNLKPQAENYTFATPKFVNDNSKPVTGVINDGLTGNVNFQFSLNQLSGNWSGFSDSESGIDHFLVYCTKTPPPLVPTTLNECNASGQGSYETPLVISGAANSATINDLMLSDGETYYFNVIAVNGVNLKSAAVASDGVTVKRLPPSSVAAVDTPDDDGGQIDIDWVASAPSDITYELYYRQINLPDWQLAGVTDQTEMTVGGLANYPVVYEFKVVAVDQFNETLESVVPYPNATAINNSAPSLNSTKVIVNQNQPGVDDTIVGLNAASNKTEPQGEIMVQVFNHQPFEFSQPIAEIAVQTDGSFPAISIGDNQHDKVWVRLIDRIAVKTSAAYVFINDIVGPLAPTLKKVATNCVTEICRVNVEWADNGPDTAFYHLIYEVEGVEKRTFNITSTSIALDLESGKRHNFTVAAFDAAGNPSQRSNLISVLLVRGVRTTVEYINGQNFVTTEEVPASLEIVTAPKRIDTGELIPKARADDDDKTEVADSNTRDWARILIVVALLLIIAISFYALSRSINEQSEAKEKTIIKKTSSNRKSKLSQRKGGR